MKKFLVAFLAFNLWASIGTSAERGRLHVFGEEKKNHKFPSVAVDSTGTIWAAYTVFRGGLNDEIMVVRGHDSGWSDEEQVTMNNDPDNEPEMLVDEQGRVWLFWAGMRDGDWEIFYKGFENGAWTDEKNLTEFSGIDWNLDAVLARGGGIWLVWESNRSGPQNDIMARLYRDGSWQEEIIISATNHHEARPSASVDSNGDLWVAYESFRDMNCDIYLRRVHSGRVSGEERLTRHAAFDFAPTVLADSSDRLWVAFTSTRIGEAYSKGTLNVYAVVRERGVWRYPVCKPGGVPGLVSDRNRQEKPLVVDTGDAPVLVEDAEGRVWTFWHNRMTSATGIGFFDWEVYGRFFTDRGASRIKAFKRAAPPQLLVRATSGLLSIYGFAATTGFSLLGVTTDRHPAVAADSDGSIIVAWDSSPPYGKSRICLQRYNEQERVADKIPLVDAKEPESSLPEWHKVFENKKRIEYNGKIYNLYFGDLHTHSGVSDGMGHVDHVFLTQRLYYGLDFGASTDHAEINDQTGSEWARCQSYADLFNDPKGDFLAFPGYEWTMIRDGGGHHTAVFPHSGVREMAHLTSPYGDTKEEFMESVRSQGGLIGVHTQTSRVMGFNYDIPHDNSVEPFIEVISMHGIGEYSGNPYELGGPNGLVKHGFHVQDILERGLRYGMVGSTDSHYTYDRIHLSSSNNGMVGYMGVYTEELSREAVFEALKARRVFATSGPQFLVDFRINGHMMGQEIKMKRGGGPVEITARVESLSPLDRVEIIKNSQVLYSVPGDGLSQVIVLSDQPDPDRAFNYYYFRVTTRDDQFAWSSPIWIDPN